VSAREAEVLAALGEHLTNAEIAARLFISVRTVESHVSSLLRKLQLSDRRALAAAAGNLRPAPGQATGEQAPGGTPAVDGWVSGGQASGPPAEVALLPAPLTSFVGRAAERAALAAALREHGLVTAVGPGGVGKTRLALSVTSDVAGRYADGAWYVDLVPVTDPAMVAPAIAAALGLGERQGRSSEDSVAGWLAARQALLVLDNCEHLLDGMPALVERLLAGSPRLTVLLTSRARLLVPFEWVFPVPGLSVEGDGDAVELFAVRAAAAGRPVAPGDMRRVAAVCRGVDGVALAIELTAARFPSLGLDGIEAGLADRMNLLAGGRRADDRHRSLRSALDWSYALLDQADQAVLRRISVFAAPFTAGAAEAVCAGWPPAESGSIAAALARLADQSLLVTAADGTETRYRALETIRQYGAVQLDAEGEATGAAARHLGWCLEAAAALGLPAVDDDPAWRSAFDLLADELRAALGWAAGQAPREPRAYRLAVTLAELAFARGLAGESQRRYEQAAGLAAGAGQEAAALHYAAGAAKSRHFGDDALRLHQAAAEAGVRAGDRTGAAADLAQAAELCHRARGLMATAPADGLPGELIARGWSLVLGDGNATAEARLLIAEAYDRDNIDPVAAELADRAIALARRAGDPLAESTGLDKLTAIDLVRGELRAALASALRRTEILAPLRMTARSGLEHSDALFMSAECATTIGDLRTAREMAERIRHLPFHREEGHLANARLMVVTALTGDWDETLVLARQFREGWEQAGRPRAGNLTRGAYAAAAVHGLRGDETARTDWLNIVDALATPGRPMSVTHVDEFFDALQLLHEGDADGAMRLLSTPPEHFRTWFTAMWQPWYAALWAEAAVLTGHPEATARIGRARLVTRDNPVAAAIVDRAAALAGDRGALVPAAAALEAAGCRYQWARTLVAIGGTERVRGEAALAAMGATVMAWPPG
jgi:predicted ATPase/DNA-binding CsgD family transcriptional regulator